MRLIKPTSTHIFGGSERKYYELNSARLSDVEHFANEESLHKHSKITEVLFVLEGIISIQNDKKEIIEVHPNEIILIQPDEWHITKPLTFSTRVLVFKYVNNNEINMNNMIKSDYINMVG